MKPKIIKKSIYYFASVILAFNTISACHQPKPIITHYYSGNDSTEILVPLGDTLCVLLKQPVPGQGQTDSSANAGFISNVANDLQQQGYTDAGFLTGTENVLKLLPPKKLGNLNSLERESRNLKNNNNKLVLNAGYLARIKKPGEPGTNGEQIFITSEIMISFRQGFNNDTINSIFNKYRLAIVRRSLVSPLDYTVTTTDNSTKDALALARELKSEQSVRSVSNNIIFLKINDAVTPADTYYANQWNLSNTGAGTEDADIDADKAWDFTLGSSGTIVAVIDGGFDVTQEDLINNFAHNAGEVPGNDQDDDGNTYKDDTIGWNFMSNSNYLIGDAHGTAVTGIAAAEMNDKGIAGVCPGCSILPIRTGLGGSSLDIEKAAIEYAIIRSARIINMSWHAPSGVNISSIGDAVNEATDRGIIVFAAVPNDEPDLCTSNVLAPLSNVVGVSRSDRFDSCDNQGIGSCVDILAPSAYHDRSPMIITTDEMGSNGYNNNGTEAFRCSGISIPDGNYTDCFQGTSAAVPQVSGVAGLILSLSPGLTPEQVRYLIQDCADKIEDSRADYDTKNGKSSKGMHGYGRVNAYEAAKIASGNTDKGGRNGVDIFFRDNKLDWGNTEKPSSYLFEPVRSTQSFWVSMDIKVRPPGTVVPPDMNNAFFEGLDDWSPEAGQTNKVFVRVRNRGFNTAKNVKVKLYWVHASAGLPPLPDRFWDDFPNESTGGSEWHSLGSQQISEVKYSGASIANTDTDPAQIVSFDFPAPVPLASEPNHYCLMALISSPDDPMPTPELITDPNRANMDYVTTHFNNATHRNYQISGASAAFDARFYIYNPYQVPIQTKMKLIFKGERTRVRFPGLLPDTPIYLNRNEKRLVTVSIDPRGLKNGTELTISQLTRPATGGKEFRLAGGITYFIRPDSGDAARPKK